MSLYERGNVYWSYVYLDGVRHAKSTGTPNRRQAELIDQRFRDELNLRRQQFIQSEPDLTFGALAARFLASGDAKPWHPDRLKILLPYYADTPIGRISKASVREYRKWRHQKKGLSETTVKSSPK